MAKIRNPLKVASMLPKKYAVKVNVVFNPVLNEWVMSYSAPDSTGFVLSVGNTSPRFMRKMSFFR